MPRPKESERKQSQENTRQRLLEAAANEFAQKGYAGANIDQISRSAGYAKGTVYNYFQSKRTLLLELINTIAGQHFEYIRTRVMALDSPFSRLACFFKAGADFVYEYYERARLMVNILYSHDIDLRQELYQAYLPMFQFLAAEVISPGVASGDLRAVDPFQTASLLMTIYLGTASQVDERRKPFLETQMVIEFITHALAAKQDHERKTA
jgi:AcrR family transcriptional regulator